MTVGLWGGGGGGGGARTHRLEVRVTGMDGTMQIRGCSITRLEGALLRD